MSNNRHYKLNLTTSNVFSETVGFQKQNNISNINYVPRGTI